MTERSPSTPPLLTRVQGRVGQFFASHAMLNLATVLLLLGLVLGLAPIAWTYAHLPAPDARTANAGGRGAGMAGPAAAACARVTVFFHSSAPVAQAAGLLSGLDASIAYGPDENGAFEVSVAAGQAQAAAAALQRADALVVTATAQRGCR